MHALQREKHGLHFIPLHVISWLERLLAMTNPAGFTPLSRSEEK